MHSKGLTGLVMALILAGCSAIEPMGSPREREPDRSAGAQEPAPAEGQVREPRDKTSQEEAPEERRSGDALSPAAASLLSTARGFLQGGDPDRALSLIQRAHGISPNAAEVYYHFAQAHQARQEYARAEQFARRGLTLAGNRDSLYRQGEQLLADIRRAAAQ